MIGEAEAYPARGFMREGRDGERAAMKREQRTKRAPEERLGVRVDDLAFEPDAAGEANDGRCKARFSLSHQAPCLSEAALAAVLCLERRAEAADSALVRFAREL